MWETSGAETNDIAALDHASGLEILGREQITKAATIMLLTRLQPYQDANDLYEWGDVSDALMHLDNVGDDGPMDDILDWNSGTRNVNRYEATGTFTLGVYNTIKNNAGSFANHVNPNNSGLDGILIITDSMRSANTIVHENIHTQ